VHRVRFIGLDRDVLDRSSEFKGLPLNLESLRVQFKIYQGLRH